jgi:aerobic carbon-monoxide dehydrogenase large subunit
MDEEHMTVDEHASDGYVGRSVRSINGDAFVSGRAAYTADFAFRDQLHAHFLRSPYASARIRSVDVSGALKVAGVVLAMEGGEAARHLQPIPHYLNPAVFGGNYVDVRCLALDRVWHYGQPVAVVVAKDRRVARYAASRIRVDYEVCEPVVDAELALAPDSPQVVPGWPVNQVMQIPFVGGDTDKAFSEADVVVRSRIAIHRQSTQPIETRSYNAVWDPLDQGVTLYASAQNPHPMRHVLAQALGLPENRLRVIAPAVGGAFGLKMHGHPEEPLLCWLAMRLRGAVKWVEDREECLLVGGREQVHDIELATRRDGRILGLRDRFVANTGAPSACPGWGMAFLTGLTMPGPYDIANVDVLMTAATTNKPPWNASRGYGKEATALVLELAIDRLAEELALDPAQVRLLNFVRRDDFPKKTPTGLILDSGDYQGVLEKTLQSIDYRGFRQRQSALRAQGRHVGIGVAYELTPEGGAIPGTMVAGWDTATVKIDPGGSVLVFTGVTNPGTGNPTGIAQIVADELGVEFERIRVKQGDTAGPYGFGNYSGRSTIVGGGAAALAASELRARLLTLAAAMLEVDESSVTLARARFACLDKPGVELTFEEVAYAAYTRTYDIAACIEIPLEVTRTFKPGLISHTA